ncbi:MAG: hypothetical protein AB8E15_11200 [Bdellovibrionales bacterium]
MKRIIFSILILLSTFSLRSQEEDNSIRPEFGIIPGTFLPFGIVGVRDQYPMVAMYYSNKAFTAPKWELGLFATNSKGVNFYSGSLSYKIDLNFYDALEMFINFGVDAHYYRRKATVSTEFDFFATGGAHIGFGTYHEWSKNLYLRSDFKFNFGPGKNFFAGLGLVRRWDPSSDDDNDEN